MLLEILQDIGMASVLVRMSVGMIHVEIFRRPKTKT